MSGAPARADDDNGADGIRRQRSLASLLPDLERFLPPSLWQELTANAPRRGVLLNALDRLRSILYLVSTYLPAHLVQEKMRRPVPDLVRGQMLSGTLLFTDVSGFTALSERLAEAQDGTERLTKAMNRYFERMLTVLSRSGGILLKFAGDALLAYFPQQESGEQARWATRSAQRMVGATADLSGIATPAGTMDLQMKVGIGTGRFFAASVGNAERMEYVVLGEAVARTMAAEGYAQTGQIVVDSMTAAQLDPGHCIQHKAGFFALVQGPVDNLDDYELRIEKRRARGAMPWSASPHAITAQMEITLRQIKALIPFLPPDLVAQIVGSALQRQVESEHRPATVLFANFTGLEPLLSMWGEAGVRRVTRLLDEYFRAMQRVVSRHGGIISRIDPYSQGSKLLVLFGAPVAHEEQPLRGVSAALAMNRELAALNDRWRKQLAPSPPAPHRGPTGGEDTEQSKIAMGEKPLVEQRIGITQGQIFAGQAGSRTRREYTVMGDEVNLAARLMAAAPSGQILMSQRIYDAVVDRFSATSLGDIRVKGKSQPIPIYSPTGPRDDPLAHRLRDRGYLVGRDAELKKGRAAIWRLLNGTGEVLSIQGPAGIGKSRLADELAAYALARGIQVVYSACRSYTADAVYAPWIAPLQSLLGIAAASSAGESGTDRPGDGERLVQVLKSLGLAAAHYAIPLANLLGLAPVSPSQRPASPRAKPPETRPADGQGRSPQPAALFARLGERVTKQEETSLDLWQLVRERPLAAASPPGSPGQAASKSHQPTQTQMWHSLQKRVAARQEEQLLEAVSGLLHAVSSNTPILLLFESAQWMDPASRTLLGFLAERVRQWSVLVVVVQRSEVEPVLGDPTARHENADKGRNDGIEATHQPGGGETITLAPLNQADTAALVGHLLGKEAKQALAQTIQQCSGGNPLFVEEIVRWLERSGEGVPRSPDVGLGASTTLQELVLSRLDSLPSGQRDTIRIASIVGSEFLQGEVRALLPPAVDDDILADQLSGLERAGVILRTQTDPEARYVFRQTLAREVAYHSQSFARRRELHASLASYLEAVHASDLAQQAELLAHHYELAERLLPAARYLLLSGDKARQRHAYPQAAGYYRRALALLQQTDDTRAQSLVARAHEHLGDIAVLTGDFPAAVTEYDAARAQVANDPAGRLFVKLAQVWATQDQASLAETYARQGWALREPGTELATASTLAWLLWRSGDPEASNWIERGKELAIHNTAPFAAGMAALLADLAGEWDQAQQAYLALNQPIGAALAACRQGDRSLEGEDVAAALAHYEQAAALWERENDTCGLALARYCQAGVFLQRADKNATRHALQEAQALLEEAPTTIHDGRQAIQQAIAKLEAGQALPWLPWRWQSYDDAFRVSILFQP